MRYTRVPLDDTVAYPCIAGALAMTLGHQHWSDGLSAVASGTAACRTVQIPITWLVPGGANVRLASLERA